MTGEMTGTGNGSQRYSGGDEHGDRDGEGAMEIREDGVGPEVHDW